MENVIKVKNLTKIFRDFTAVDDISFSVKRGEIFAFLGPNGAGKTTTIKMMTTILKPTSGRIFINDNDVVSNQAAARKSFGIVFQEPSLDDELTAYENMEYHGILYQVPKEKRRIKTENLLKFFQLFERRNEIIKKFSGGMRRRLEIARALLHQPKILFLDEPTVGLDPQTRNRIWSYIQDLRKREDLTVFFTTHLMEEAEREADRIAIIDHGQIIALNSPKGLEEETETESLEEAFLVLTGKDIREGGEKGGPRIRNI